MASQHADMENLIKEHKHGFSLEKLPTQNFHANWAYLLIGQLAFNLVAWFKKLILPPDYHRATVKTIRHHVLNVAGKIVRTARQFFLVISDEYRYQAVWALRPWASRSTHVRMNLIRGFRYYLKGNSLKLYDKAAVLRVQTTINRPVSSRSYA